MDGAWTAGLKSLGRGHPAGPPPRPGKSRAQYLPLLELAVSETPQDDRSVHYLGREYLFHSRWDDCIRTLTQHLTMPSATWADERAASMRFIAQSYEHKGQPEEALRWYLRAAAEAPHLREPLVELALLLYTQEEWDGVLYFTQKALAIGECPRTYICEARAWGALPYDLRCQAYYHTGRLQLALEAARAALALEPQDERLQGNVKLLEGLC